MKTIQEELAEIDEMITPSGYKVGELRVAFDAICDPTDWKAPISAAVRGEMVLPCVAAIQYYTATTPTVGLDVQSMTYIIQSEGYRAGPAGDH